MGSCFDYRIYNTLEEAQQEWSGDQADAAWSYGHEYSGCINMLGSNVPDKAPVFDNEDAVLEYIENTQQKWEDPVAARLKNDKEDKVYVGGWCAS